MSSYMYKVMVLPHTSMMSPAFCQEKVTVGWVREMIIEEG